MKAHLPGWGSLVTRLLGAVAVLVIALIHLQAYGGPYSAVPTIGELFLLNVAAAAVIGVTLLAPLEHVLGRRSAVAVVLVTTAGIALALVSLLMLVLAEAPGHCSASTSPATTGGDLAIACRRDRRRLPAHHLADAPRADAVEASVVNGDSRQPQPQGDNP